MDQTGLKLTKILLTAGIKYMCHHCLTNKDNFFKNALKKKKNEKAKVLFNCCCNGLLLSLPLMLWASGRLLDTFVF